MIILNERVHVEEHYLKNNEIDMKPREVLVLLAKYYYQIMGYKPNKVSEILNNYLDLNYHGYYISSKSKWEDTIDYVVRRYKKAPIFETDCIWITKSEIEKIRAINDRDLELVAFAHLCVAKYNDTRREEKSGWFKMDLKELFELVGVGVKRKRDRALAQNKLMKMGLIEFPKKTGDLSTRVAFIDDESEKAFCIYDFRALRFEYLNYIGDGKFIRCAECGKLFEHIGRGRPKKYCPDCADTTHAIPPIIEQCIDCGAYFKKSANKQNQVRCSDCQAIKIRADTKERVKKYREND